MNNRQITHLSVPLENVTFDEEISDEELMLVSNSARLKGADLEEEKKNWRKVSGDLIDTSLNDHGFSLSPDALSFMEGHFKKTKDVGYFHNFFKNHQYYDVEALMGRHTNLEHKGGKRHKVRYSSLLDRRHPLTDRADAFRNVSATIAHGDQTCSACNMKLSDPNHRPESHGSWHPVSNKAIHIETSFVTFPAYKSTTVEMSSLMSKGIDSAFPPEDDPKPPEGEPDKDEVTDADEKKKAELAAQQKELADKEFEENEKAEYKELLAEIKDIRELRRQLREVT